MSNLNPEKRSVKNNLRSDATDALRTWGPIRVPIDDDAHQGEKNAAAKADTAAGKERNETPFMTSIIKLSLWLLHEDCNFDRRTIFILLSDVLDPLAPDELELVDCRPDGEQGRKDLHPGQSAPDEQRREDLKEELDEVL